MTSARRKQIIENLKDKESRDFFVEQYISTSIPFQIRAIRESLAKTQKSLAKEMQTGQSVISQLENSDYGNFTFNTLKKLASIFDVALIVKFASFSELVDIFLNLSPEKIAVPTYSTDMRLYNFNIIIEQAYSPSGQLTIVEPSPPEPLIRETNTQQLNSFSSDNFRHI